MSHPVVDVKRFRHRHSPAAYGPQGPTSFKISDVFDAAGRRNADKRDRVIIIS